MNLGFISFFPNSMSSGNYLQYVSATLAGLGTQNAVITAYGSTISHTHDTARIHNMAIFNSRPNAD